MKKSRFTEAQIIGVLREQEAGGATAETMAQVAARAANPDTGDDAAAFKEIMAIVSRRRA